MAAVFYCDECGKIGHPDPEALFLRPPRGWVECSIPLEDDVEDWLMCPDCATKRLPDWDRSKSE